MPDNSDSVSLDSRLEYERQTAKPSDIEFERISSEEEDYESAPPDYEINTYPADFTLEVLHNKWKARTIEIPLFQRQFVWKQVQASKLVESFLVGLPVPPVFLYTERKSQKLLVIDGQQRLRSIFYFFEGYFGEERKGKRTVFELKGLSRESKYAEKMFQDLREEDQLRFQNAVLRSFIVQQVDPGDDTSIFHIFERLNTGGTLLSNQEIRNCVHSGHFNDLLHELNAMASWRRILGKTVPDSRKKDVELILRFFALVDISHYKKPMKDFLTSFMKANKNPSDKVKHQFRELFAKTCEVVAGTLGDKPFHIRAGLNSAVLDSVMTSFAHNLEQVPADVHDRFRHLTSDPAFLKNASAGTTDDEVLKNRFQQASRILFG